MAPTADTVRAARATRSLTLLLPDGPARARRIAQLYVPILLWIQRALDASPDRPLVIGLSAPQGAGKTTLVGHLVQLLAEAGTRAVAVSIDDFYLRHAEQQQLADSHPGNPYLLHRGYPGTHDIALGAATLTALRGLNTEQELCIPAYDKSLHGGRGDRLPRDSWPVVHGPLKLVLLEGWMLGFCPVALARIADPHLREINEQLAAYEAWLRLLDALIILRVDDLSHIPRWRIEAEENAVRAGKPGLDRAAIEDYVRRFLPAYALYADTVETGRFAPDRQLVLHIGGDRLPLAFDR